MLEIKITKGPGYFNRHCDLCGCAFETHGAQPRAYKDGAEIGLVCETCIAAGPDGIAARMRDRAAQLENMAAELRHLAAGEISSPTADELVKALAPEYDGGEADARKLMEKQPMSEPSDPKVATDVYFGGCPECKKHDGYVNVSRSHWFVCDEHQTKWLAGSNLFSSWHDEGEVQWKRNSNLLAHYTEVEPVFADPDSCKAAVEAFHMDEHALDGATQKPDDRWQVLADMAYLLDGKPSGETHCISTALGHFPSPESPEQDFEGYAVHQLLSNLLRNQLARDTADAGFVLTDDSGAHRLAGPDSKSIIDELMSQIRKMTSNKGTWVHIGPFGVTHTFSDRTLNQQPIDDLDAEIPF